jgi:methylmalonyl-CoA mutase
MSVAERASRTFETEPYATDHQVRVVTAAALFDGHDAAINIMRRLLQSSGAEVIHLGHNRSVAEVAVAAVQEDVQAVAVSSYQGGHMEFFRYLRELLDAHGGKEIRIFGGGGGVIVPEEIELLHQAGIHRIFSPEDGRRLGLQGIINHILRESDSRTCPGGISTLAREELEVGQWVTLAQALTCAERAAQEGADEQARIRAWVDQQPAPARPAPVLGITGTGGAGKSSLTDELVQRYLRDFPDRSIGILSVDPTKRKTGGAFLGDRIRMNSIYSPRVFMRSMATRGAQAELSLATVDAIRILQAAGFDLIIVETSGIGQGASAIVDLADSTLYVMTCEYGAATQLEKIDMLDFADLVAINKFERRGSEDAYRDVSRQLQRRLTGAGQPAEDEPPPVYGTIASRFNDPGVNGLYVDLLGRLARLGNREHPTSIPGDQVARTSIRTWIIPPERVGYLREVAECCRSYRRWVEHQVSVAQRLDQLTGAIAELEEHGGDQEATGALQARLHERQEELDPVARQALEEWPRVRESFAGDEYEYTVRDRVIRVPSSVRTLAGLRIPKVCCPRFESRGELLRWLLLENVPGRFPFTAGVFPLKRAQEDPTRMFAGEGPPARTNRRFHYLSKDSPAKRLSVAFDSVTLYGEDPDPRPDIYGKVGDSGVSIATLDDMKVLFDGFELTAPNTSVSMTINGPAPIILAMFFNTAVDQEVDRFVREQGREPSREERERIRECTLQVVRGTVQADILKEDQGQNTCIFSTEFALRMMGDVQEYFISRGVRNYYSVSISGYHIAEAGANPISQLAFTLANAFTYVEYYRARGMEIDAFAPSLSFFFSNGLDAEYTVIGRVARRIWSVALRDLYEGGERSQKLKYHIQTSGRSLHAMEVQFNDIRTTLQGLTAYYDNCQSLHTNAYDEAVTTPTEESVRRALAIQQIIAREFGLAKNENPLQGSFIVEELTDLVEEAVLCEFERISARGGVLGAMETQYQRSRIQEESLYYERLKHSGELPIIGVNTFVDPRALERGHELEVGELIRATPEEKQEQLQRVRDFQARHQGETPEALARLTRVALEGGNIFEELMETVRHASLGQISGALYEVGGAYRRNA